MADQQLENATISAEREDGEPVADLLSHMSLPERLNTLTDIDMLNARRRDFSPDGRHLPELNVQVSYAGGDTATIALDRIGNSHTSTTIYSEQIDFRKGTSEVNFAVIHGASLKLRPGDNPADLNTWYGHNRQMQSQLRREGLSHRADPALNSSGAMPYYHTREQREPPVRRGSHFFPTETPGQSVWSRPKYVPQFQYNRSTGQDATRPPAYGTGAGLSSFLSELSRTKKN